MKRKRRRKRSCLGCGVSENPVDMVRFSVGSDGEFRVGRQQTGRGGYLHWQEKCWQAFLRKKSLYRAFHVEVGRETRENLIKELTVKAGNK